MSKSEIACTIRIHDSTGDADLLIYKDGVREDHFDTYYLEDGGVGKALEVARTITAKKPFIKRV